MTEQSAKIASEIIRRKSRFLLVVDSDADNLSILSRLFQRFNYQFITATTAKETLELATVAVPSLVITALDLKDMNGMELMRNLKQNPRTTDVPFIALSSQNDQEIRTRCFELGAVGCLFQPVDAELLYRTVQVAIEKNPRMSMRVRTVRPVKVNNRELGGCSGVCTLDLSDGGMYLRTTTSVPVDTGLSLQIDLNGRTISAEAIVLYNCKAGEGPYQEPGMGLRFAQIAMKDQEFIRQFIRNDVTRSIAPPSA